MTEIRTIGDIRAAISAMVDGYYLQTVESEKTMLDIGYELVYAAIVLTTTQSNSLRQETAEVLDVDLSTINKVVKIAANKAIRENKDQLPRGWTSLYLLCQIEPEDFKLFMDESKVECSTTRENLAEMIQQFIASHPNCISAKTSKKKLPLESKQKIERMTLKQCSANATPSAEFEVLLKQFLKENGWELVKPKEKPTTQSIAPASSTVIEGESHANNEQDFEQKETG